jgi:hypothetical protein
LGICKLVQTPATPFFTRNEQESGSSSLVGSLYSVHWHQDIEAEKSRFATFVEGSEFEHDDLASMHNCKHLAGLEFRALISEDAQHLKLARG